MTNAKDRLFEGILVLYRIFEFVYSKFLLLNDVRLKELSIWLNASVIPGTRYARYASFTLCSPHVRQAVLRATSKNDFRNADVKRWPYPIG
jgi:hypothetical protein